MRALAASSLSCLLSSCASIIAPGPDIVPVNTMPPGATVSLDGINVGTSPTWVTMPRSCGGVLRFEMPGHKTVQQDLDKVVNGWVFGSAVFGIVGVVIGLPVDLIANNQGKYSTNPVSVVLPDGSPTELVVIETRPRKKAKADEEEGGAP